MTNVHFHPDNEMLLRFASGDLDPITSIMVSAHLECCHHCQQRVGESEHAQALTMFSSPKPAKLTANLQTMLTQIMDQEPMDTQPERLSNEKLRVGNTEYSLPRALQRQHEKIGPWSKLPGKIKRAHVDVGGSCSMNFIYMESNSVLPEHTHKGLEITLVLAGEFYDENGTYRTGDFIVQTAKDKHLPRTHNGQDCLCLTLLDAPLHFTSGLATLFNPFSQLFFRH